MTGPICFGVDLVGGDDKTGLYSALSSRSLKHLDGPHEVRLPGVDRLVMTNPNQRLSCEMKDHGGLHPTHHRSESWTIPDISLHLLKAPAVSYQLEEAGLSGRLRRKTNDLRPQLHKEQREPTALETGGAGDKNLPASPEAVRV